MRAARVIVCPSMSNSLVEIELAKPCPTRVLGVQLVQYLVGVPACQGHIALRQPLLLESIHASCQESLTLVRNSSDAASL